MANSVGTEPLTTDHRKYHITHVRAIVNHHREIHAPHIESTPLSQVRVANVDQGLFAWVLGGTRIRYHYRGGGGASYRVPNGIPLH
ncbi:hypothetical protein BDN72DRAFT_833004 [Pluteus cervinus]|uniref:Uncharacterized protein n=1 Tax=Pluteus cervinus TaxID=181527 RepID=A0ACD3B9Z7_9AGAR|nr:hypothetical protein BDN72DRAFT_833004 [Pluteus cervinus]